MLNRLLRTLSWLLCRAIVLLLMMFVIFSVYGLWSNHRVFSEAENVYNQLLLLKPNTDDNGESGPSFKELRAINRDVCGWITIPGTKIDYPIVRGADNMVYLNQNVFGQFSLAGSIYLDTRNSADFNDSFSLIYGHHMDQHMMFGDLDMFKDQEFFQTNQSATIVTDADIRDMKVLAVLQVPDSDQEIFQPDMWGSDLTELAEYVENNALYIWDDALAELKQYPTTTQAIALATCSDGATGNRTVVILTARREDENPDHPTNPHPGHTDSDQHTPTVNPPAKTGDSLYNSPILWAAVLLLSPLTALCAWFALKRKA